MFAVPHKPTDPHPAGPSPGYAVTLKRAHGETEQLCSSLLVKELIYGCPSLRGFKHAAVLSGPSVETQFDNIREINFLMSKVLFLQPGFTGRTVSVSPSANHSRA